MVSFHCPFFFLMGFRFCAKYSLIICMYQTRCMKNCSDNVKLYRKLDSPRGYFLLISTDRVRPIALHYTGTELTKNLITIHLSYPLRWSLLWVSAEELGSLPGPLFFGRPRTPTLCLPHPSPMYGQGWEQLAYICVCLITSIWKTGCHCSLHSHSPAFLRFCLFCISRGPWGGISQTLKVKYGLCYSGLHRAPSTRPLICTASAACSWPPTANPHGCLPELCLRLSKHQSLLSCGSAPEQVTNFPSSTFYSITMFS